MIEWIVTSSILTLIIIGIRFLFLGKISLRLQYALWGLLLMRLLLPVTFGSSAASVANLPGAVAQQPPVQAVVEAISPQPLAYDQAYQQVVQQHTAQGMDVSHLPEPELEALRQEAQILVEESMPAVTLTEILTWTWMTGMVAVCGLFTWTNLRFWGKLRRTREPLAVPGSKLQVYVSAATDTPCLFGLLRPAIYLTEDTIRDGALRRHSIAHETTHCRHGDHIWSLLRGLCLAVHWYNPLVWWAAFLSQRDGELACDEGTLCRLGEQERAEYGRTLIGMTCRKRTNMLSTATTMHSSKSGIKERILLIVRKPKNAVITLTVVALIAAAAVLWTFVGAQTHEEEKHPEPEISAKGQSVFPEGNITGMTIHYDGFSLPVGRQDLRKMTAWVRGFVYGDPLENGPEGEPASITVTFADGSAITAGIDVAELDGVRYQVLRPDYPNCWNRLVGLPEETIPPAPTMPEGSQETWPDETVPQPTPGTVTPGVVNTEYTVPTGPINANVMEIDAPELGTLYDRADPDRLCIAVTPTGARAGDRIYYHTFYIIPEDQEAFLAAWKHAFTQTGTGGEDENASSSGWSIAFRGERWFALSDGTFTSFYGNVRTDADSTKVLYDLCLKAIQDTGLEETVHPEQLLGIRKVTLNWFGIHTVTDPEILAQIEDWLVNSIPMGIGGAGCPFTTLMTVELENGETRTIAMAADDCCVWMSQGVYYRYDPDYDSNEKFYSLFASAVIREAAQGGNLSEMLSLSRYLDWQLYARAYGQDAAFALMDLIADWVKENPDLNRCAVFIYRIQGLEGQYRTRFGNHLAEIYKRNPKDCAWAIMGNAGAEVRSLMLEILAEVWDMDPEAVAAKLKAQYGG